MNFDWDEEKNQINIKKHHIDFNDAKDIFQSVRLTAIDSRRDYGETRKHFYEHIEKTKTEEN